MDNPTLSRPPLLIVDPELEFLLSLSSDPQARTIPPIVTHDELTALKSLEEAGAPFAALFVNPRVGRTHAIPLIRQALKAHPGLPIFYMTDAEFALLPVKDIKSLGVRKVLQKPLRYGQLLKAIQEAQNAFSSKDALERAKEHAGETLEQEAQASDEDFLPISAINFVSGSSCFFDIYVRLKPGKYVKILQAGDAFSADRVTGYRAKGVTHFYLRKAAQEAYLKYCDQLASTVVKNAKISHDLKISVTANQGEEVASFLRERGVTSESILHAEKFVGNVHELAKQMGFTRNPKIAAFLKDLQKSEHGVALTLLSSFLIRPLQYTAEKSVGLIGMASLLHDVGLSEMDPKFIKEDLDEWAPEERWRYQTHPDVGAETLAELRSIDPAVIQAVRQHHERRNRNGFPHRIGAGALNQVSEIVGVCDDFLRLIKETESGKPVDLNLRLEMGIYREFSMPIVEAFKEAFKF
jgi:HD-GYP domain-containing protein (c-di-GMP phosphodiesterase class II)